MMTPMAAMHRRALVTALDALAILGAYWLAFLLRFDFAIPESEARRLLVTLPYPMLCYLATSHYFGVNRGPRYRANFGDAHDILKAVSAAALLQVPLIVFTTNGFPRSVLLLAPILCVVSLAGLHAFARDFSHYLYVHLLGRGRRKTAVIVGVGDLATLVYRNMRSSDAIDYKVLAFVDPSAGAPRARLHGARVIGGPGLRALLASEHVDELVIAVAVRRRGAALDIVADALQDVSARPNVLVAPTLEESLKSPTRAEPRKVRPVDLLNRRVISLDAEQIARSIEGKVVLISGAGGTIGGELARQVARNKPRKLVLIENSATALFYIESELRDAYPQLDLLAALGDVRDLSLLNKIFRDETPQTVFHAAAHKHVHQLETNICEGVSNNLLGTYHLATAADKAGVETFILISTDKAVRPTSVMGATKRAAEIVITNLARRSKTRFAAVRFGNVLGSSGSVMKIFQEQIEKGQPLTITHPEATRYFMTVEEAVGLVLQASTLAKGGEIFVLKMGDQVRILDMAKRLIWLTGLEPERDVPIRFVGLRAGEKLAEELVEDDSGQEQSEHPEIMVLRSENKDVESLAERILGIELLSSSAEKDLMIRALAQLVPTFRGAPNGDGARISPLSDRTHGTTTPN